MGETILKKFDLLVVKKFKDAETGEIHDVGESIVLHDPVRVERMVDLGLVDIMGIYNENK